MRMPLAILGLLFLVPLGAARASDGDVETWDRVHMAGAHAGYAHTRVRTVGAATKQVESRVHTHISIQRAGTAIEIVASVLSRESTDGVLERLEVTSKMSANETTTVYAFTPGHVTITTTSVGTERSVDRPVPANLVGPVHAQRGGRRLAGTSGETYTYTTFLPDLQTVVVATSISKGIESIELADGSSVEATRVDGSMTTLDGTPIPMAPITWLDDAGEPIKTQLETGGMVIETFRVGSEAAAKAEGETHTGPNPDVFLQTLLLENDPIPVPRRLEEAWIVVRPRKPGGTLPTLAGDGHTVTTQENGSVLVHAVRRVPPADKQGLRPLKDPPPHLVDALASSSMIQADAPEIVKIAQDTVGDEPCAWVAAQRLEAWVDQHITVKGMGVAFGSALEACRAQEGDCTEHAVLLAALCRAAGIPARVVMGLEYMLGIWGGHAWNEVWIEDAWYPLDATNGLGFVDPLHLPLAHMVMKEGAASEFISLMSGLGTLDVDIVEVMRDGRRIRVDDPALVTMTDGSYSNAVLGISFQAPGGWTLDAPTRGPGMSTRVMDVAGSTDRGRKVQIAIDMMDAPADGSWETILKGFRTTPDRTTSGKVDGRAARALTETRTERTQRRVIVLAEGAVWAFTLDHAEGALEERALAALLDTVDFDVR